MPLLVRKAAIFSVESRDRQYTIPAWPGCSARRNERSCRLGSFFGDDAVLDVRPVEGGDEHPGARQLQPDRDLLASRLGRGGGQRDPRHVRPPLVQHLQFEVVGAEVVAPLRHAVRLVDREQGDLPGLEQPHRGVAAQPFRREVQQVELAGPELLLDHVPGSLVQRRVEEVGAYPELAQRLHLVLHERDQRRDDHPGARPDQRRNLVAQRLAAAGRHQHERVVAGDHMRDDRFLVAAERLVPENPVQDLGRAPRALRRAGILLDVGVHAAILRSRADNRRPERRVPRRRVNREYVNCAIDPLYPGRMRDRPNLAGPIRGEGGRDGRRAARDAELAVDVLQVLVHRPRTAVEATPDRGIGQAFGRQAEHLLLPLGQLRQAGTPCGGPSRAGGLPGGSAAARRQVTTSTSAAVKSTPALFRDTHTCSLPGLSAIASISSASIFRATSA